MQEARVWRPLFDKEGADRRRGSAATAPLIKPDCSISNVDVDRREPARWHADGSGARVASHHNVRGTVFRLSPTDYVSARGSSRQWEIVDLGSPAPLLPPSSSTPLVGMQRAALVVTVPQLRLAIADFVHSLSRARAGFSSTDRMLQVLSRW